MSNWIDVTQPLTSGMVFWPGQAEPRFERISNMDTGDMANVTKMSISVHTGTHMDAPLHFFKDGADITQMPPEAGIGRVRVMHYRGKGPIGAGDLREFEQRTSPIQKGERIFFKTRHSDEEWLKEDFKTDYVSLSAEGAEYLREKQIQLVGIDYLSIAPYDDLESPHHILLGNNIWIVEGLRLREIEEGPFELICVPLKIDKSDGSPARVLLRK